MLNFNIQLFIFVSKITRMSFSIFIHESIDFLSFPEFKFIYEASFIELILIWVILILKLNSWSLLGIHSMLMVDIRYNLFVSVFPVIVSFNTVISYFLAIKLW